MICEQQYGFMLRKSITDAMFALRKLAEKYREGPKEVRWGRSRISPELLLVYCGDGLTDR